MPPEGGSPGLPDEEPPLGPAAEVEVEVAPVVPAAVVSAAIAAVGSVEKTRAPVTTAMPTLRINVSDRESKLLMVFSFSVSGRS